MFEWFSDWLEEREHRAIMRELEAEARELEAEAAAEQAVADRVARLERAANDGMESLAQAIGIEYGCDHPAWACRSREYRCRPPAAERIGNAAKEWGVPVGYAFFKDDVRRGTTDIFGRSMADRFYGGMIEQIPDFVRSQIPNDPTLLRWTGGVDKFDRLMENRRREQEREHRVLAERARIEAAKAPIRAAVEEATQNIRQELQQLRWESESLSRQMAEPREERFYDAGGTYLGKTTHSGSTVFVYDRNGNVVLRRER